jgi:beta-1,4-mannosyl-glycoprotein beta-1,4-N-acetylglucosaminyltransferase
MFIDTFLFNGDWIVKLRLAYLYNFVDVFYVVEGRYTFSGLRKETLFTDTCRDWFEPYMDKIRFIISEKPAFDNAWQEETYQRNLVLNYILDDKPPTMDYVLAVCDCDEIYDIDVISKVLPNFTGLAALDMSVHYYRFTHVLDERCSVPFMIHSSLLKREPELSQLRATKLLNGERISCQVLLSAGWHFSFFMSIDDIQRKIQSYAHTEYNIEEIIDKNNIQQSIETCVDVLRRTKLKITIADYSSLKFPPLFQTFHEELLLLQTQ